MISPQKTSMNFLLPQKLQSKDPSDCRSKYSRYKVSHGNDE